LFIKENFLIDNIKLIEKKVRQVFEEQKSHSIDFLICQTVENLIKYKVFCEFDFKTVKDNDINNLTEL
jgi:hypothetical protein